MPLVGQAQSDAGRRTRRVLLAMDAQNPTVYGTLAGIRQFERETRAWELALPGGDSRDIDDYLRRWRPDGVIGMLRNEMFARARQIGAAAVTLVSTSSAEANLKVYNDPVACARMAFEHFRERQLTNLLLFVGAYLTPAMRERADAFAEIAADNGVHFARFDPFSGVGIDARPSVVEVIDDLARWLGDQPTPAGLWAISDACGWQAVQACAAARLSVPDQVAVLGYKNEVSLCEFCVPPLSSVAADQFRMGYEAAGLLDRLMRGGRPPAEPIRIPPLGIVHRQSTDTVAVDDHIVLQAVRFIRTHAGDGIGVDDVLDHVRVSASTLLRRFKKHLGATPARQIQLARLDLAARLLATTDQPLAEIASATGYSHLSQFCREFKQHRGLTPTGYRQRLAVPVPSRQRDQGNG